MKKIVLMVHHANGSDQVNPMVCDHHNQVPTYGLVNSSKEIPVFENHSICLDCLLIDPPVFHESILEIKLDRCSKGAEKT